MRLLPLAAVSVLLSACEPDALTGVADSAERPPAAVASEWAPRVFACRAGVVSKDPLIIVDGRIASPAEMQRLGLEDIVTVEVIKGGNATATFGSRAAAGVVIVTTRGGRGVAR